MARSIAVDATEAWRAVIVMKTVLTGKIWYIYEGIYNTKGTAKGRVSYHRKHTHQFYDGWVEKADITWNKVKD